MVVEEQAVNDDMIIVANRNVVVTEKEMNTIKNTTELKTIDLSTYKEAIQFRIKKY